MAKKRKSKEIIKGTCIRCKTSETMEYSGFCKSCSEIKCNRSACDNRATHEHIFNKGDWYCISCAKLINDANKQFNEPLCFDIF
jgi:hypothetical protein